MNGANVTVFHYYQTLLLARDSTVKFLKIAVICIHQYSSLQISTHLTVIFNGVLLLFRVDW